MMAINSANLVRRIVSILLTIIAIFPARASAGKASVLEETNKVVLCNDFVKISFSKGDIFDMDSFLLGGEQLVTSAGDNLIPWIFTYKGKKGENPMLYPSDGIYRGYVVGNGNNYKTLVFIWDIKLSYSSVYPVQMSITLFDNSELVYWGIRTELPPGWVVTQLQFPHIIVKRPSCGKIITSAGWGNEYDIKTQTYSESYPSHSGSMQLLLMHSSKGAFYYATEDKTACGKELKAICSDDNVTFLTDIVASESWTNPTTGKFSLPWLTTIGYTSEGWQSAVMKWYRPFTYTTDWGKKIIRSRGIPQWLIDKDLWIRAKGVNDTVMNAVRQSIAYYGKGIGVHWYYWHHYPYDTHYPDYFPAKEYFADMIKEVQRKQCHVVPYINGRLWDPNTDSYNALNGHLSSCRKPDGTLYTEIYPTSKVLNTVTCPASSLWQDVIISLVDKIQKELKTDGVYIDQVAAAAPAPCWANNHGHAKGGGNFWYMAYREMINKIRNSYLKKGNILISEENAECYIDMFDLLLTVNTPHDDCKIVPLFPMVYSDRVITCAYTYTPTDKLTDGRFRYENMQCFLFGSQLGWVDPTLLMRNESELEAKFLKTLVRLRSKYRHVFYDGHFVKEVILNGDNPTVKIPTFGETNVVHGTQWTDFSGRQILFLINMDEQSHEILLPDKRRMMIDGLTGISVDL